MELFGTSLGEYEGTTELFDVFCSECVDVHNHVLLNVFEKEGRAETRNGESTRRAGHFVRGHLVESFHEKGLELHEESWELVRDLAVGLEHPQ